MYDAAWTPLVANAPYAALMGDPSTWRGREHNAVWRQFSGIPTRARYTSEARQALEAALAAELWDAGSVGHHEAARKTIDHPQVGPPLALNRRPRTPNA